MAENFLITGYRGEPHITPENDRGIHAGLLGTGRFVLEVGEQFRAEYIGSNTIRMYDGKLMDNGAAAGIPASEYVDLTIANAGQGMKRNDLIVFQYTKDSSTNIESGEFVVIKGTEYSGTPVDPELIQADLLTNTVTIDQMPLWRVTVSGTAIAAPEQMFATSGRYVYPAPVAFNGGISNFGGCVQGGAKSSGAIEGGKGVCVDVTFQKPFKTKPYVMICMQNTNTVPTAYNGLYMAIETNSISETGFKINFSYNGSSSNSRSIVAMWLAIGEM